MASRARSGPQLAPRPAQAGTLWQRRACFSHNDCRHRCVGRRGCLKRRANPSHRLHRVSGSHMASAPWYLAPGGVRVLVVASGMPLAAVVGRAVWGWVGGGWPRGSEALCAGLEHSALCRTKARLPAGQATSWPGWVGREEQAQHPLGHWFPLFRFQPAHASCILILAAERHLTVQRRIWELASFGAPRLPTSTGRSNPGRGGQVLALRLPGLSAECRGDQERCCGKHRTGVSVWNALLSMRPFFSKGCHSYPGGQ